MRKVQGLVPFSVHRIPGNTEVGRKYSILLSKMYRPGPEGEIVSADARSPETVQRKVCPELKKESIHGKGQEKGARGASETSQQENSEQHECRTGQYNLAPKNCG